MQRYHYYRYELLKEKGGLLTGLRLDEALLSSNVVDTDDEHILDEQIKLLTEKCDKLNTRKHTLKQRSSDLRCVTE